jgi:hypothetical protein
MDSDIEDMSINQEEVNRCFRAGIDLEGTTFLERVEKHAMEYRGMAPESKLTRIFDKLVRKVDQGKTNEISIIKEFGDLGTETILNIGRAFIETQRNSTRSPRSPPKMSGHKKISERYDDDFEDYDDDFEEDEIDSPPRSFRKAQTTSLSTSPSPKYIEQDPIPRSSKSAPTGRGIPSGSMQMEPRESPKYGVMHSTKFQGTSLSWIKKGHWRKGEKIGSGSFGEVFQGMTDSGLLFAVKCLNYNQNVKEMKNLIAEVELMQSLCHPNIVQYLGASVSIIVIPHLPDIYEHIKAPHYLYIIYFLG